MSKFLLSSPTHSQITSVSQAVPGEQQVARRMKMLSRCGFDNALNILEYCSNSIFRYFDIFQYIVTYNTMLVKRSQPFSICRAAEELTLEI